MGAAGQSPAVLKLFSGPRVVTKHEPDKANAMEELTVKHDPEDQEFTTELDGYGGELAYSLSDQVIDFTHTYVDEPIRGQGVANHLIKAGLQYAEENKLQVIASCPAVAAYIRRHPEYQHLLQ